MVDESSTNLSPGSLNHDFLAWIAPEGFPMALNIWRSTDSTRCDWSHGHKVDCWESIVPHRRPLIMDFRGRWRNSDRKIMFGKSYGKFGHATLLHFSLPISMSLSIQQKTGAPINIASSHGLAQGKPMGDPSRLKIDHDFIR